MKWFSISGIISETKKIQWPKGKDLARDSMTVFLFVFFLGVFFYLCQFVTSAFLKVIGI
ncbi:preprotein translocase subunit SecE [Amedibacillus sp. YH-ame10]